MMAPGMTPAKRFAIRASMVAGSTVALVVGAQTLIAVDVQSGRAAQNITSAPALTDTQQVPQQSNDFANSGVRVIRGSDGNIYLYPGDDDSVQGSDDFFNQQQTQLNQQPQLFSSQQTFRRPRTSSSR